MEYEMKQKKIEIWNECAIHGMKTRIASNSIDCVFTDPPYGIDGDKLHAHYARDEKFVVPGYVEVSKQDYSQFSQDWITECARVLRPGGSFYCVTGYTGLRDILNALASTDLEERNHLIWKFNFPVYTKNKFVSTHYHILYWIKPPQRQVTFNTFCRFQEIVDSYHDREDVFELKREYQPGQIKNKNQLPESLVEKFLLYSTHRGHRVLDPFMGGFTTAKVSLKYGRVPVGFEKNSNAFNEFYPKLSIIQPQPDPQPHAPDAELQRKRQEVRNKRNAGRAKKRLPVDFIELL
jgi:site-specific DNA-methyltransferase (adenine-specific)